MVTEDPELQNVTKKVTDADAAVCKSVKCSTAALPNASAASGKFDHRQSKVQAQAKSQTHQWIKEAVALDSHITLKAAYDVVIANDVGRMADFCETIESSFIDKCKLHNSYLKQIRKASEMMQKKKYPLCKCQHLLDLLIRNV